MISAQRHRIIPQLVQTTSLRLQILQVSVSTKNSEQKKSTNPSSFQDQAQLVTVHRQCRKTRLTHQPVQRILTAQQAHKCIRIFPVKITIFKTLH